MRRNRKTKKPEEIMTQQIKGFCAVTACALALGMYPPCLFSADTQSKSAPSTINPAPEEHPEADDLDTLKRKLLQTSREWQEYKAALFRSSHPKDEAKISELGKLLAEKEALNQQLADALQSMDKEVILSRKQLMTQETSNEVLCSYVESQKQALRQLEQENKQKLTQLEALCQQVKTDLAQAITRHKEDQQRLLALLKEKQQAMAKLQHAFQQHKAFSHSLVTEITDLSYLFSILDLIHQEDLVETAGQHFTHLELAQLLTSMAQAELKDQAEQGAHEIQRKQQLADQLQKQIHILQQALLSQTIKTKELEKAEVEAVTFANELTNNFIVTENQLTTSQKQLSSTLTEVEKAKQDLLAQLQQSKEQLVQTADQKEVLAAQIIDSSSLLDLQQHYAQTQELNLCSSKEEVAALDLQIAALSESIEKKEREGDRLQGLLLNEKISTIAALSNLDLIHQENVNLQARLEEETTTRAQLAETEQEREKLSVLAAKAMQEMEQTRSTLNEQLQHLRQQIDEKEQDLETYRANFQEAQQMHETAKLESDQLKQRLGELEAGAEQHQRSMADHLEEKHYLTHAIEEKQQKLDENENALKMQAEQLEILANKHAEAGDRNAELETDLIRLAVELREKEKEVAETNQKVLSIQEQLLQLRENIAKTDQEQLKNMPARNADEEYAIIDNLNKRLNEIAVSLEKEMVQRSEMEQAMESLIIHSKQQSSSLAEAVRVNRSLGAENDYLILRLKEATKQQQAMKAKEMLRDRPDHAETVDLETRNQLFPGLIKIDVR